MHSSPRGHPSKHVPSFVGGVEGGVSACAPRLLVCLGAGASAEVVEEFSPASSNTAYFTNAVAEVFLAEGAQLTHGCGARGPSCGALPAPGAADELRDAASKPVMTDSLSRWWQVRGAGGHGCEPREGHAGAAGGAQPLLAHGGIAGRRPVAPRPGHSAGAAFLRGFWARDNAVAGFAATTPSQPSGAASRLLCRHIWWRFSTRSDV